MFVRRSSGSRGRRGASPAGHWVGSEGAAAAAPAVLERGRACAALHPSLPLYLGCWGSAVTASPRTAGSLFLMNQFSQGGEEGEEGL